MKNKIRIGINGFGRIGRVAARIISSRPDLELAAINSMSDVSSHAYLLQHDSTYGLFDQKVFASGNNLLVGTNSIKIFNYASPSEIPWDKAKVDVVIDATGKFRTSAELAPHLKMSVKYVVLSAPAKDDTKTLVLGVNENFFNASVDKIISNSSCTTNCLATTLSVLDDNFKVKRGFMTTIHAVTDSQNLLDNSHKKEVRLRRAAFASIIPASTGSAKDITKLFPNLSGKLFCQSLRVPLLTVSLINLTVETKLSTTGSQVNTAFSAAANMNLKNILHVAEEELVSKDYTSSPYSSIIDPFLTSVVEGNLVNVYAWYDNEWGYTERLVDLVEYIGKESELI